MKAPPLDQTTLRSLLDYDPDTGIFTWRTRADVRPNWNGRYAGKRAGYAWTSGGVRYWSVRIFDWPFQAHRLAWLYMTGQWPTLVDHRDGDGLNNRWSNLREATRAQNFANSGLSRRNKSGFKGVSRCARSGRWRANIKLNGRQTHLGHFDTPEEAHAAYCAAAVQRDGEFARLS